MGFLKKHFSMYSHLPKEIYVLAFGKVMTSMGGVNMAHAYLDHE